MALILYKRSLELDSMMGHVADLLGALAVLAIAANLAAPASLAPVACVIALTLYPVIALRYLSGTLGQRIARVRVITWEGDALSWKHAFRRVVGQMLVMALLVGTGGIGFIWFLVDRYRRQRAWHDRFAGTRMVRAGEPDPGPPPPRVALPPAERRLRARIILGAVVGLALILSSTVAGVHYLAPGTLVLVAPEEAELRAQLDDAAEVVIPPAGHLELELKRGEHMLRLRVRGQTTVESFRTSGGFWRAVVRAEPDQCFVLLDVTRSHYRPRLSDGTSPLPDIKQRYDTKLVVFDWPSDNVFFDVEELPARSKNQVRLVQQVKCKELGTSDEELLRERLGYRGKSWREINAR